ncbi:ComEC/Rec2 family competence protein [Rhizobium sp.]|uniref:ComEC/Rec2 family competence protein n=1 Tax=Rhizobium sp. TaxID=391 RepID=UPI0028AB8260
MANENGFEIDFLAVGEGERSGDAIAIRWVEGDRFKVLVYDGGTKASGQQLVDHIKTHYQTTHVDYVVNSHPDGDHASGLSVVLEQLTVGELWLHRPWEHSETIRDYFHDGRITDESLRVRLQTKMSAAYRLEELANQKDIPINEPYQGAKIGPFLVMSPSKDWYIHELVADFAKSPAKKVSLEAILDEAFEGVGKAFRKVIRFIAEEWHVEYLRENVTTSAENESSVILLGIFGNKGVMLTGDAGVRALNCAAEFAEGMTLHLPSLLNFIQVPHHGSRNNVSTSTLDKIIGEKKRTNDSLFTKTAFVSASAASETHPRRMVENAFSKRGAKVYKTKGRSIRHSSNMPSRDNWISLVPVEVHAEVEAWD